MILIKESKNDASKCPHWDQSIVFDKVGIKSFQPEEKEIQDNVNNLSLVKCILARKIVGPQ